LAAAGRYHTHQSPYAGGRLQCATACRTISDNTDFLSYKARFVADQDFYDVVDASEGSEITVTYRGDEPAGTSSAAGGPGSATNPRASCGGVVHEWPSP
jgi:hypothetical protein